MENNQLCTDQVPTSGVQGTPVNGINIPSKVFGGQASPALVACHAGLKHGTLSSGSTEVSGSAVPLRSRTETSEFSPKSTPSPAQSGGATPSCSTPCSAPSCSTPCSTPSCSTSLSQDRKTLYSRNVTVDRRSNELRSSKKSPSVVSSGSPATLNNGNHGSSGNHGSNISPGNQSNGNRSTGMSTSDSIFTYSLTDESHDELDDVDAKRDRENEAKQKTLDFSDDVKTADLIPDESTIPVPCDNNNFVDKIKQVKNVIQKEYVHTITYTFDELTSFEKHLVSINAKSELCQSSNDEQLSQKLKKTPKTSASADHKDFGHKKFSSRTVKNFLRSMSPASRHRKPSKSSDSLSSRSSNTLAGSLDSASVGEELEETGASCKTTPKTDASRKTSKSPGTAKKSPADSHSSHGQKSKTMICDSVTKNSNVGGANLSSDPVTKNSKAGEANLSSDCQVGEK